MQILPKLSILGLEELLRELTIGKDFNFMKMTWAYPGMFWKKWNDSHLESGKVTSSNNSPTRWATASNPSAY